MVRHFSATFSPRPAGFLTQRIEAACWTPNWTPRIPPLGAAAFTGRTATLPQFHAAKTEKYAHATFFFNGGRDDTFPGEERLLIPSPKVATYDLQPEMSAPALADAVVETLRSRAFPFLAVNSGSRSVVRSIASDVARWIENPRDSPLAARRSPLSGITPAWRTCDSTGSASRISPTNPRAPARPIGNAMGVKERGGGRGG